MDNDFRVGQAPEATHARLRRFARSWAARISCEDKNHKEPDVGISQPNGNLKRVDVLLNATYKNERDHRSQESLRYLMKKLSRLALPAIYCCGLQHRRGARAGRLFARSGSG